MKKSLTVLLMMLIFFLVSEAVQAQTPQIDRTLGAVLHHGQLLVQGANFGAKDPALPLRWFDMENGVLTGRVGKSNCGVDGKDLFSNSSEWPAYVQLTGAYARGKSQKAAYHDFSNTYNRTLGVCNVVHQKIYATFWSYTHDRSGRPSRNFKRLNSTAALVPYGDPMVPQIRIDTYPVNDNGHLTSSNCNNSDTGNDWFGDLIYDRWERLERYSDDNNGGSAGMMRFWRNGTLEAQTNGSVTACAVHHGNVKMNDYFAIDYLTGCPDVVVSCTSVNHSTVRCTNQESSSFNHYFECLDGTWRDLGTQAPANRPSADVYSDDVYVDNTLARVEICPNPQWDSRGGCEIQLPTAWGQNEVTVQLNQGALPSGSDAYLFVVTGAGTVSNSATVRFVESGDSLAPAAPSSLRIGE